MKKNITVNIFGALYPVDEDAYAMLNSYIVNMRDYFSRQPDGKEIADDIEARVAELMADLRRSGVEAISIGHVEEIISRIGSPEQLGVETPPEDWNQTEDIADESVAPVRRKLFRDPDHKVIGGVLAGLGCYFGINPLWLRLLAFVSLFPTFGIIIAVYLICWASIPMAVTPADRLQMKGESINVSSLCEEFLSSAREMISRHSGTVVNRGLMSGIASTFKVLVYAVCILLLIVCVVVLAGILFSVVCALVAPWGEMRDILGVDFPLVRVFDCNPLWLLWVCGISLVALLAMSLFIGMHFLMHMIGKVAPMSRGLRVSCVLVWIAALIAFAASWTEMISNVGIRYAEPPRSRAEMESDCHERQLKYLGDSGWTLVKGNGVEKTYTRQGGHYSGNDDLRYLHGESCNGGMDMEYEVVRHMKVAPGTYRLEAAARANGKGAEIFAVSGKRRRLSSPIPACGSKGGDIWSSARQALDADSVGIRPDHELLKKIVRVNDKKGSGWSKVTVDGIVVGPDSILTYGVTNRSNTVVWDGTWLSASSFELFRKD